MILYELISASCLFQIHQGFSSTAEAFARTAGQDIDEDITSIQNRQAIQKLVLAGRMGDAITMTNRLYPGFLQRHPSLHFMLKVKKALVWGGPQIYVIAYFVDQFFIRDAIVYCRCGNL